jgi:peroxin-3
MALIPTLAEQILEEMDVESLTNELQSLSRTSRFYVRHSASQSGSEVGSASDAYSDAGSVSVSSYSGFDGDTSSMAASTSSWVDRFSTSSSHREPHDFLTSAGSQLSDSITTASSSLSYNPVTSSHVSISNLE